MFRIPDDSQRIAIVGATGSGKTVAAIWQLSNRNLTERPWVIYNWKMDPNIDNIPWAQHIELDEVPIKPGVYIVNPKPSDTDGVEVQMWEIWNRGKIGVYVDEGYMVGVRNPAFRAILTQGRSKEIPVIVLSQRPVWMDRFVFSESEFFQIFRLQHNKDRNSVQEFIPKSIEKRLPDFHSYYYDVGRDEFIKLRPVPDIETIYDTFNRKLKRVSKVV